MTGKVCVVTGANSGIGRAVAEGLARQGATVAMVCRDLVRGEEALRAIREATRNEQVALMVADLSSQKAVRRLAEDINARYSHLDVLVNNAAIVPAKRAQTEDGLEMQFAVNHVAPFLLTNLLLDKLQASAPSRIINVSSDMHAGAELDWNDLQAEQRYSPFKIYSQTKLANVLFTVELARRLAGTGVTVNCLHPGVVRTGIMSRAGWLMRTGARLAGSLLLPPAKGAETILYLAASPEVTGVSGQYFYKCERKNPSAEGSDPDAAEKLWDISVKLTGLAA